VHPARRGTAARAECRHGGRSSPRDASGLWLETKVGGNGLRSDGSPTIAQRNRERNRGIPELERWTGERRRRGAI
jgi:hypothetical protein